MQDPYRFKIATEHWELSEINKLNHETFSREIPQHPTQENGTLIDQFHDENVYLICIQRQNLLGMLALRDKRPFSLEKKLPNFDQYVAKTESICEGRLLSIKPEARHSKVFLGLLAMAADYCEQNRYDSMIISGIVKEQKLYKHIGFRAFGPLVGTHDALYQPMCLTLRGFYQSAKATLPCAANADNKVSYFLPGPVEAFDGVYASLGKPALSHRSSDFIQILNDTKQKLCKLVNAKHVEIFTGSGTLANDVIAAQLSKHAGKGLILSNGEFGERLIDHGARFNLDFNSYLLPWGQPFNADSIIEVIESEPNIRWLWASHCETSTGMLNNIKTLKSICVQRNIHLCLDCISSIGNVVVDLQNIHLASGVSSKGVGSVAGLALIYYNDKPESLQKNLPRYLDLYTYACQSIPYTLPSNLVLALNRALDSVFDDHRFEKIAGLALWIRKKLKTFGLTIITPVNQSNPAVITIALPNTINSCDIGEKLDSSGYLVSYQSQYLLRRNWLQICLMGNAINGPIKPMLKEMRSQLDAAKKVQKHTRGSCLDWNTEAASGWV